MLTGHSRTRSLGVDRRIGDVQREANALNNIRSVYQLKGDLRAALDCTMKALRIFTSIGAAMYADMAYGNLQKIVEQMKVAGMELSQEDRAETAELTGEYEGLRGQTAGATAP